MNIALAPLSAFRVPYSATRRAGAPPGGLHWSHGDATERSEIASQFFVLHPFFSLLIGKVSDSLFTFAFLPLKRLESNRAFCDHSITANRDLHSVRSFAADQRLASANSPLAERLRIQSETRAPPFARGLE